MAIPYIYSPTTIIASAEMNANLAYLNEDLVPTGTILPFYDYNGALTFNAALYKYCDGQTQTVGGSLRVLPDLSNRYLVGFGT
jgi:hypothetical protein